MNLIKTMASGLALAVIAGAPTLAEPKYKADVPASILTPDAVETRLGTLHFKDGAPHDATTTLVYAIP
jgi:hypothetical protein